MAAACGGLQHIFESPLPENPTLIESLTWNKIKPITPMEQPSSFTEIFGELHFKENPASSSSSSSSSSLTQTSFSSFSSASSPPSSSFFIDFNKSPSSTDSFTSSHYKVSHKNSDSFSSMNSESLQLCTEGLGFESCDDVEDNNIINDWKIIQEEEEEVVEEKVSITTNVKKQHPPPSENLCGEKMRRLSRRNGGSMAFPPPISSIGKSGRPWVCFKSYRNDGRFVLKEVRIPTQEFLHAFREDGRLKLHFVQPDDKIVEEDEEQDDVEDNYDDDDDDDDDDDEEEEEEEEEEEKGEDCCNEGENGMKEETEVEINGANSS